MPYTLYNTLRLYDRFTGRSIRVKREVAAVHGGKKGPNIIFIADMDRGDTDISVALFDVMTRLQQLNPLVRGKVYGLTGLMTSATKPPKNLAPPGLKLTAAEARRIYLQDERMAQVNRIEDRFELWRHIESITEKEDRPFAIINIREGAYGVPHIQTDLSPIEEKIVRRMPVRVVTGLGDILQDPMCAHLVEKGHHFMHFVVGTRNVPEDNRLTEAMMWLALSCAGNIRKIEIPDFRLYRKALRASAGRRRTYFALFQDRDFHIQPVPPQFHKIKIGDGIGHALPDGHRSSPVNGFFYSVAQTSTSTTPYILASSGWMRVWRRIVSRAFLPPALLRKLRGVELFSKNGSVIRVDERVASRFSLHLLRFLGYEKFVRSGHSNLYRST